MPPHHVLSALRPCGYAGRSRHRLRFWRLLSARQRGLAGLGLTLLTAACASRSLPDPHAAAVRYAAAVERGDAQAVHTILTQESQRGYGLEGTRRLLAESRQELRRQAQALKSERSIVETLAVVRFSDGEQAVLEHEAGRFRISSAAGLPAGARTPEQALEQLRTALARRSYPALIRVLSKDTRSAMENDLRALVTGLEQPQTLDVKIDGDRADVTVPGGHRVRLKREAGIWRVQDFD
jgi:hypothetical protein